MSILVTDTGFSDLAEDRVFVTAETFAANDCPGGLSVDLAPDADPGALRPRFGDVALIRIDFPSFADGRGFTLARLLRLMGYTGRLRARGHVIADQYAMARRAGFDEVEISEELAARQPQEQWRARANWQDHDYQSRLRG